MRVKLTKQLKNKLIQVAALLMVDASDGDIDDADHLTRLLIETGQEIRKQNGLEPI